MIHRQIQSVIEDRAKKFPVVTLTGPRQCGKSTLLKSCFPDYRYVSLEDPDVRALATDDPRGFLQDCGPRAILDEAQRAPDLFSYIQTLVDSRDECGQFVLSGSHNFLLMERVSQSLAGRACVLKLSPFSIGELDAAGIVPKTLDDLLLTGGFPRLYDKRISPGEYFPSYLQTYVERDVRLLRNISDMSAFSRFLRLCAARAGSVLNVASLAADAGVTSATAKSWLSILEASYVVFLLEPHHRNFSKRVVKSPKLYFRDTGLLCHLLGIRTAAQLRSSDLRGAVFECFVVSEFAKAAEFAGEAPRISFWRDTNGNEVDLLSEQDGTPKAFEIKSGETRNARFYDALEKFAAFAGVPLSDTAVVYGGDASFAGERRNFVAWRDLAARLRQAR